VLDKVMRCQQRQQQTQGIGETGRIGNMIWPDTVQLDVEWIKPGAGVDQHREGLDLVVGLNAGEANLANARRIATGGFDIQGDKAEVSLGHPIGM
jgi:hypothetical protein